MTHTGTVGYIVHSFPRVSLTFILREILALEKRGLEIVVFSLSRPDENTIVHPEFQQMKAPIIYVPKWRRSPKNIGRSFVNIARFVNSPRRLWRVLSYLLQNRHKKLWYDFLNALWLATQLPALGVTHLHAHAATSEAAVAMFAAMLTGRTFSFTAHASDIFPVQEYLHKKLDEAKFVVAISEYNRNYLTSYYGHPAIAEKIYVVHCGIALDTLATKGRHQQSDAGRFRLITVGRLVEQKGHHILVDALAKLRNRGFDFQWIVVGEGPRRLILEQQIESKQLQSFVEFTGAQPTTAVTDLLLTADIFILPCIRTSKNMMDGIPVSLMEAMALGIPAVSTAISGIPELIEDQVSGYLVAPDDSDQLAGILVQLMSSPEMLDQVRLPARTRIEQQFSMTTTSAALVDLFLTGQRLGTPVPIKSD
jgi:colanic acid/amylovoran biosynthesis glycosyltransferase